MKKSIADLTKIINQFADERDWHNDNPTVLITALLIEMGELAEHYQWQTEFSKFSKEKKVELGYEFVDVIFYLLRLASKSGIDIEEYFDQKVKKLAEKYPVGSDWYEQHRRYRETGKNKRYE